MSFPFLGVPAAREQKPITLNVKLWNEKSWEGNAEHSKSSRRSLLALPLDY